jgi:hypothetical protein
VSASPSRRDLMKPVQLLGLAFASAVFAGIVTLVVMGAFQARPGEQVQRALVVAAIAAGVTFIAVLVILALLLLAVDPAQVGKTVDRPVLLPDEKTPDAADPGTSSAPGTSSGPGAAASGDGGPAASADGPADPPRA